MPRQRFDDVQDALEISRSTAESIRLRSQLMVAVDQRVRSWNVTLQEVSERLGIPPHRVMDLSQARIDRFSLEDLIDLALRTGVHVNR